MNSDQMEHLVREVLSSAINGDFHLMEQQPGLQEILPTWKAAAAAFSERGVRFPLQFTDGEEWVATRMIESGRHTGEFMGFPPSGRYGEFEILLFHQVIDGFIVAQHSQVDGQALLRLVGAIADES